MMRMQIRRRWNVALVGRINNNLLRMVNKGAMMMMIKMSWCIVLRRRWRMKGLHVGDNVGASKYPLRFNL